MSKRTSTFSESPDEMMEQSANLIHLLRARALRAPDRLVYTFLLDGEAEAADLTYAELDAKARAIGAWLQESGMQGQRVLLLYPPGLEYNAAFWGCVYAGAVAVPAYPPRVNRTLLRLQSIVADAQAAVALTTAPILSRLKPLFEQAPELKSLRWGTSAESEAGAAAHWRMPDVTTETLAFLQYTSGSTAAPKGVMVSHGNLLHNEELIRRAFGQTEESVIVGWLPVYHDMGLIGNVLQPLYVGARCILMSPAAFLQRPSRWLQAISRYRATTSGGPNFAYDLCVRKVSPEECAALDLSSWTAAFNGAEPVRAETLEQFAKTFEPYGFNRRAFYPCYGLAEATLLVSAGSPRRREPVIREVQKKALENNLVVEEPAGSAEARRLVGCGGARSGVVIVNPESLTLCAGNAVGEVWVGGASVAGGYWKRPDETAHTFHAYLADTGAGPYLRTGDLGFINDGELFITGRLKDLIIIRGRNLYAHDIERVTEESHRSLRPGCGAAFSVDTEGEERLIVVQEVERRSREGFDEIVESVRRSVAEEFEVQPSAIVLVKAGSVPKTSSGKVQRRACREMFLSNGFEPLCAWHVPDSTLGDSFTQAPVEVATQHGEGEITEYLRTELASRLGVDASQLEAGRPASSYGLDSLLAIELAHRIESRFGVVFPMAELLQGESLSDLAGRIRRLSEELQDGDADATAASHVPEMHPLSHGQQALWFLHRIAPESAAYNVAAAVRLRRSLDADVLRDAFQSLVERHPALRTTFEMHDGAPVQRVSEHGQICFEMTDASLLNEEALRAQLAERAHRPFVLAEGPLLRVSLLTRTGDEPVLLLVAHHIVVDFWSLAILVRELGILYEAGLRRLPANLPPLETQYVDYVRRQARALEGTEGRKHWEYWQKQLAGELPLLNLPTDRPRPPMQTFRGTSHATELDAVLTRRLKALERGSGATLYMVLLAAFQILLSRHTGQEEILVGSPSAGRSRAAEAGLVGYFVNPLVLRTDLSGDPTFEDLLGRVRPTVLDAFAHQDYPFPLLVQRLQPERDASRTPLFQAMFVFQQAARLRAEGLAAFALGEAGVRMELGGLVLESLALEHRVAQFDLTLAMAEAEDKLLVSLEYNTDLFDKATVKRMARHFQELLRSIVEDPQRRLSDLSILTEEERRQLLTGWNQTRTTYALDRPLHAFIDEQASRTPHAIALVCGRQQWTYSELNQRADSLARHLRSLGVASESLVGVLMERSVEMVVALLGVLKAGGAYVPLDPDYPAERLAFMLADTAATVLLTQQRLRAQVPPQHEAQVICLDTQWHSIQSAHDDATPLPEVSGEHLAYVIYTSGSTGKPKGAMNTHRGIVNRLLWMQDAYQLSADDRVLQKTPFSFDVSVWEFFWPLMTGARLVMAAPGGHQDVAYLARTIKEERITTLHFVPSMLQVFLAGVGATRLDSLRRVICSGEALSWELQERFHEQSQAGLHNLYGPTEAAVDVSFWACERGGGGGEARPVPIGRPIANTQLYVLDKVWRAVAVGVVGELHIGGVGVGRGYVGRADLTAERFIPDAYGGAAGGRLYRTGDLARFLADGTIEYLGRLDYQVKVRGFRIELGEVEAALAQHEAVHECVVAARADEGGDTRLVAYLLTEPGEATTVNDFRRFLAERLPEYMIPAAFVLLEAWPLLSNGKVDRKALPAPTLLRPELEEAFVAPHNQIEELLAAIFASVLGVEHVGIHDNFFDLGGHSLLATQVVARIQESFQIEVPLRHLFKTPTVAALAEELTGALSVGGGRPQPIEPVERSGHLPLSFAQQRLWFLDQLELGSTAYNIPVAIRLRGHLDTSALERSLGEIVNRHESLRTTFVNVGGEPVQVIAPIADWSLPVEDVPDEAEALRRVTTEARERFDLASGPLLRARLLRCGEGNYILLLTMHHIVSDGWSIGVFIRELVALYQAFSSGQSSPLPALPIQYADFVQWQRGRLGGTLLEEQLAYWRRQLGGELPVLNLPSDKAPASAQTHEAATEHWKLSTVLSEELKHLSRKHNVTLYMTLLAAFQTLLSRYTGVSDVAVGTPVAGRLRVEAESLIGFFVNTLVMRGDLSDDPTFAELLERTREVTLEAHANQEMPFEMLVEELQPARDFNHTPLFQVMLVLENAPLPALEMSSLSVEQIEVGSGAAKFDLILFIREGAEGINGTWEFDTDRFDPATIRRMAGHFETILRGVVADPLKSLSGLPLLTEAEEHQLLIEWNDTATNYPRGSCMHHLFEEQARRTPHAIALVCGRQQWTYSELNQRAASLARHLRSLGVTSESLVGVLMERSVEMVVALLGVLKAGGAYVPLDPDYPAERLAFMLSDTAATVLLTQQRLRGQVAVEHEAQVIYLDTEWQSIAEHGSETPALRPSVMEPDNLAYLIYTSGSSGRPKGVAIEHHSAVTLLHWALDSFAPEELEGVLASTSICFDLSVFEIFVPLSCGGKVILAADALELVELPAAEQVTLVNTVPSAMAELMRVNGLPASVMTVNLAGEALQNALVQRIYEQANVVRVVNLYGPSEDTTYSTWAVMKRGSAATPPIGRPVADTQVYVLDDKLRPVPVGIAGELYISGAGLARGYLNRPGLTAERFIPNPSSREPGTRMYKTGDLARFLPDGQLDYLGRLDQQVKVRGFRIELGEIESVLGQHAEVQDAVVVARRFEDELRLVAYIVAHPGMAPTTSELRRYLKDPLPDYMIPSAFVILEKLPLTPNGKVDRRALPEPEQTQPEFESVYLAPRTPVEEELAGVWSRLLRVERIGVNDNFFEMGGHSLLATRVVSRVRELFQVELPLRSIFETPTIARLADRIELAQRNASTQSLLPESARADFASGESPDETLAGEEFIERVEMMRQATYDLTPPAILPIAREVALPLSFAQQRLWFHDQLSPGSAAYNIVGGMRLEGRLNVDALEGAINEIVCRHEALRTTFMTVDGQPMQVIASAQPVALTLLDLRVLAEDEREDRVRVIASEELNRAFDLSKGPLLRVALLRLGEEDHVALVTMHHIAGDGWSIGIFVREVAALYRAFCAGRESPLAPLPIQYADYASWQREWMQGEVLEAQLDFWRQALGAPPPPLELPTDYARPEQPTLRGEKLLRKLPADLYEPLRALSHQEGATLYMTLLTAFLTQLYRYTHSSDLMVGTAIAGRNRVETEDLIGIFINMLVVRADLSDNPPFRKLLGRVREVALGAYAHQDMPFEKLVEALQPERALSQTPLFQVAFGLQNAPVESFQLPGLKLSPLTFSSDIARFDLTLWVFEGDGALTASWTYSTELFKPETIERMHHHFERLLRGVVENPEARLDALEMLTAEEKRLRALRDEEREEANTLRLGSIKRRAIRAAPAETADAPAHGTQT